MPLVRTRKPPTVFVGVRLPAPVVAQLDALADAWSRPGFVASRSDVVRVLLEQGVRGAAAPVLAPAERV